MVTSVHCRVEPASYLPLFFSAAPRPPDSPLFPYTTLFRSATGTGGAKMRDKTRVALQPGLDTRLLVGAKSEEHTSELQSLRHLVCRLLLEKKNNRSTSARGRGSVRSWTTIITRTRTRQCAC